MSETNLPDERRRILFLTRDPVLNKKGGSTTLVLTLLELLVRHGVSVTMVTSTAHSRSPQLWFRVISPAPNGVTFLAPGYLRFGSLYIRPFAPRAWARAIVRAAAGAAWIRPLAHFVKAVSGETLYTGAWDLTEPTQAERRTVLRMVNDLNPTTVLANYAFWGPLFAEPQMQGRKRVIVMHDLLSARTQQFVKAGIPLDCPPIDEATEMRWLSAADSILAAQQSEAEAVQPHVKAKVLVQPIVLSPHHNVSPPEQYRCLFVGTNIPPNVSGLAWLLAEVWPKVLQAEPHATLAIVGTVCKSVPDTAPGVIKLGRVESIDVEYAKAAAVLVPLLIGSGLKIKLIEALSFGKAVVSTSIGMQGIDNSTGAVDVADDAEMFARCILWLLADESLRHNRAQAALKFAEQKFGASRPLDPEFVAAVL